MKRGNQINLVLVGDEGAGKHELIHAITHGELESLVSDHEENKLEFELDGYRRVITLCCSDDDEQQNLMMLLRAHAVILCYGIDSQESLGSIATKWVPLLHEYCPETPTTLLACKSDLRESDPEEVSVGEKQIQEVAKMIHATRVVECSAFKRENLLETFVSSVRIAVDALEHPQSDKKKCIVM